MATQPHPSDRSTAPTTSTLRIGLMTLGLGLVVLVNPAVAQTAGDTFCTSALAETARNLFTVIQFGGPLLGGVVALGATVWIPMTRNSDIKREMKELRTQGLIWGVIVAPLATELIQFILTSIVAGGGSCAF